ncbi:MAG: phosphate signaling complex protein PhoU [Pseudomonadota bacterium]|jgi:phosphate transport system protein
MSSEHIVRSYDEELNHLNEAILKMGGLCEAQFAAAIEAVANRDPEMAAGIAKDDVKIDEIEMEVDRMTVRLLALRQPMATDLREIIAALKISSAIERIGDYAANVAKRAIVLAESRAMRPANGIPRMGRLVQRMIKDVLDAYVQKDAEAAKAVWLRDAEVDDLYSSLFREVLTYMMEDPRNITPCTHLLFIAKNIERIGDHTTNIAEMIYFMVTGRPLMETRPKGEEVLTAPTVAPRDGQG